ncbi:transposase [Streptomyces aureus]|uniref:transposase n=1 Tax=Streptomyces aureus TaxID=193461 RepID=UPI000AC26F07|nr:transposase [Streptomyces aureus]
MHELLAGGLSRRAIGRQLRMTSRTVKLFADAATPEDLFRGQWQGRPSKLDAFKPYLDDRRNQGCTNAWAVWEEIAPLGYQGSYQRVRAYFRKKRISPNPITARPPSPRVVAGWILRRLETRLPSLHTLAAGIERDRNAVIAGLTLPWNSGVVEGHVNRIKMLKRQMFGRTGFALLKKRVLLAS